MIQRELVAAGVRETNNYCSRQPYYERDDLSNSDGIGGGKGLTTFAMDKESSRKHRESKKLRFDHKAVKFINVKEDEQDNEREPRPEENIEDVEGPNESN
jgi:hypothetical protein